MVPRITLALGLVVIVVAGCARAPAGIEPTLAAVEALGAHCGDGVPDGAPSGLVEWTCKATADGDAARQYVLSVMVDGNDQGVARVVLVMDTNQMIRDGDRGRGPDHLRTALGLLVDRLPLLSVAPALRSAMDAWDGADKAIEVGHARIGASCPDDSGCSLEIDPIGDATEPMQLP